MSLKNTAGTVFQVVGGVGLGLDAGGLALGMISPEQALFQSVFDAGLLLGGSALKKDNKPEPAGP